VLVCFFSGRFFELQIVGEDAAGRPTVQRTTLGHSATYRMIYTDLLYYLLCFALPLVSLAFMNWTPETGAVKRKRTFRAETKTSSSTETQIVSLSRNCGLQIDVPTDILIPEPS